LWFFPVDITAKEKEQIPGGGRVFKKKEGGRKRGNIKPEKNEK